MITRTVFQSFYYEEKFQVWELDLTARKIQLHSAIEFNRTDGLPLKGTERHFLDFSPDGKLLALANRHAVFLWDVEAQKVLRELKGASAWARFSRDGKRLMTRGQTERGEETMRTWEVSSGKELSILRLGELTTVWPVSPDGKKVVLGRHRSPLGGSYESPYSRDGSAQINELKLWDLTAVPRLKPTGGE